LPFGLKGHAVRSENLRNRYIWFKSPKWDFWFPRSWNKHQLFLGARIGHFAKRGPSDIVKELFGYFFRKIATFQGRNL
jgi:hypothetical protein